MRDIKARAWDYNDKKWHTRIRIGVNCCHSIYDEERQDWFEFDELCGEIVLYTGLKDKNGKEIYEGDIFKREDCWPIYQVIFSDDHGCFCLKSSGGSPRLLFKCLQDEFSPASEILGNIYENPELLEGTSI